MKKHEYNVSELNSLGIDNLEEYITILKNRRCGKSKTADDDAKAYLIINYILEHQICSLRAVLPFVVENNLWSAWRRGQATFIALVRENEKFTLEKVHKSYTNPGISFSSL